METFTFAAVSLTIAISLLISKKKTSLHRTFAWVCAALFLYEGASFFDGIFQKDFLKMTTAAGLLSIPPLSIAFTRVMLGEQTFLSRAHIFLTIVFGLLTAGAVYVELYPGYVFSPIDLDLRRTAHAYVGAVLVLCYLALVIHLKRRAVGAERKRLLYLVIAAAVPIVMISIDLAQVSGYGFSFHTNIILAALIYFILMIITHPQLTELHDLMARALVIFLMTFFAAVIILVFTTLFGSSTIPFSHLLVASFLIMISIEPFKQILKKILKRIYPEIPDVFTSLYALDEKLEREKSQLLEEMAPVLAHEIRNPLGSMKGAAQYLRSEEVNEENQKLLDVIIEETDRLNSVVSQFLNYAKPYVLNRKVQPVNRVVEKAISVIRASHLPDNLIVEEDLRPDLPPVRVDAEQLIQVILNIAYNAIEAMPDGGKLILRTSKIAGDAGEAVGLSIRDTGKGMKREEIKSVFKPFFTTKERGVGLGLAICQRIVRSHGGRLKVKSIPGQGSIFYIRIDAADSEGDRLARR
jgi:two-component system sensor histidine kinase HydH